jgi:hypothetical protein
MSAIATTSPSSASPAFAVSGAGPRSSTARLAAGLAVLQVALFAVPMVVLGRAIGWPASLRLPAAEALPLVAANAGAVQLGYWAYLLVSLALVPLAFALRTFALERGFAGPMVDTLAFLGAAAGILKTLGIVRWLSAMPALAAAHAGAGADVATRQAVETAFLALNAYAGSVGELLGVQLVSGLWLVGTGVVLARLGLRLTGVGGIVAGLLFLATALRTVEPAFAAIQMAAVPFTLVWFLMLAGVLMKAGRA